MKLCGKYHSSGRLYTTDELAEREAYSFPLFMYPGYHVSSTINPLTGRLDRSPRIIFPFVK